MSNISATEFLDTLERRFSRIYPLALFARYAVQSLATFAALDLVALFALNVVNVLFRVVSMRDESALDLTLASLQGYLSGSLEGIVKANLFVFLPLLTIARIWKSTAVLWAGAAMVSLYVNLPRIWYDVEYIFDADDIVTSSDVTQVLISALLAVLVVYYVWAMPIGYLRGALAAFFASRPDSRVMRETPSGKPFPQSAMSTFLGYPPLTEFTRDDAVRYAGVVALSMASGFFLAVASIVSQWWVLLYIHFSSLVADWYPDDTLVAIVTIPFLIAVVVLIAATLGRMIERANLRLIRFSLEEMQRVDLRPPILFLRAFADDQVELSEPKLPHLAVALEVGRRRANLDEMLLQECTPYGPLVALGSPTDRYPPYGAARGYFDNKNWHQAVEDLVRDSAIIVMCVDITDGIWWEAKHIAAVGERSKTLFLMHPSHRVTTANTNLLQRLMSELGLDHDYMEGSGTTEPRRSRRGSEATVIGFFIDLQGCLVILRSSTFSRLAYLLAIRRFVRAKCGMPAEYNATHSAPAVEGAVLPDPRRGRWRWSWFAAIFVVFFLSNWGLYAVLSGVKTALDILPVSDMTPGLRQLYERPPWLLFRWAEYAAAVSGLITLIGTRLLGRLTRQIGLAVVIGITGGVLLGLAISFWEGLAGAISFASRP